MSKIFASLFIAAAVVFAPAAFAVEAPKAPIILPAKPGNITFEHQKHLAAGVKCTSCHKDENGGHIEGIRTDVNKDKAHATCQGCHKEQGKGPQKCGDCHKKA